MVTISVPATTANLGPGFDCLGAALSLSNLFRFSALDQAPGVFQVTATGPGAASVSLGDDNLVNQAFQAFYHHCHQAPPAVHLEVSLGVPLARGLGSSATAILAGLLGANALADYPLTPGEVLDLGVGLEGHPDNLVPALKGGCQLAALDRTGLVVCSIPWHPSIVLVAAIPDFQLSTQVARQVLPLQYSRTDAVFNAAHLGLLVRALETGRRDWLVAALQDRIHQPYRLGLIRGAEAVIEAAVAAGAHGAVISGAGPTLLALAESSAAPTVQAAMTSAWSDLGVSVQVLVLTLNPLGATIDGYAWGS